MSRRALVIERPGEIDLATRESLRPGPGEIVARPAHCGLCATDLELLRGEVDLAYVRYPVTIGHEWSGVVTAVGDGVDAVAPGDACVVEGLVPCGRCAPCRAGATNVCLVYDELGFTREGGAGDEVLAPARLVHRLEPGVSLLEAALVEPTSVVAQGLSRVAPRPGERVVVIGDGTIALLATHLLRLWSPAAVTVLGRRPAQAALATAAGADSFTVDDEAVGSADLVIEAAGAVEAVATAIGTARRGGRVLLLGLPPAGRTVSLPADLMVNNDLTVAASFGYTQAAWSRVVELLNAGRIEPARIVTHRFPLDDYARALAALEAGDGSPRGKVVLDVA
jgi:2-desacetyl-2-hydroxyethyl bacteriochlorophyllide A dehydrogenase